MDSTIRDEVRSLKRDKILDVAAKLFSDRGYHGTSIDSICNELGVTKPFIYYHFARKDDILLALYQSSIDVAISLAEAARNSDPSPQVQIRNFVVSYTNLIHSDFQSRIALNSREKGLLSKEMMRNVNASKYKFVRILSDIVETGREMEEFVVEDALISAQAILGILHWTMNWYRPESQLRPDDLNAHLVAIVFRSLGASPTV